MLNEIINGGAQPQAGSEAGQNANVATAEPIVTRGDLAKILTTSRASGGGTETEENALPPEASSGTEPPPGGTAGAEAVETLLPGQEETPLEAEVPPENEAGDAVPTNAELTEALGGLDATQQGQLAAMLADVQNGTVSWNDLKQGHKIAAKYQGELQKKDERIAELEAGGGVPPLPGAVQLPEPIAKLKTLPEVQSRFNAVNADIEAITDFLDSNEGGPDAQYEMAGGQQYTRKQLIDARANLKAEAKLLPQRAQQLQTETNMAGVRKEAQATFAKDFAWAGDPESAPMKAVNERLKTDTWLQAFPAKEQAAHGYNIADAATTAEKAFHKKDLKAAAAATRQLMAQLPWLTKMLTSPEYAGASARPQARPAGKVPLGKPHQGGGAGGAGGGARSVTVKSALDTAKKTPNRGSFAAMLAARKG